MLPYTMHDRRRDLLLRVVLGTMVGPSMTTTVTGVSPLSLLNALAGTLLSLEQAGKCVQNGTPTPLNPINIKCNNGSLKMVDDELPIGYKRITSIKFDGDFWYETGEALTGDDDVTITLDDTASSGQNVFGSYNGTSIGKKNFSLYIYGGSSTSSSYLRYGEQLVRPKLGSGLRTITFGKRGTSGFQTDVSAPTPDTFATPANAYIGMLPNSSSPAYTGSIIGNILVGTRLKWIPCERESDGVVGYYEAIEGTFLDPTGTGTPVAGNYDTSHLTKLEVVGSPEVLTISANGTSQTASVVDLFAVGEYKDTQDIISGDVSRNVKPLALTGQEEWTLIQDGSNDIFRLVLVDSASDSKYTLGVMCTNYETVPQLSVADQTLTGSGQNYDFVDSRFTTVDQWKTWLAAQYSAGVPVILLYPLASQISASTPAQSLSLEEGTNTITVTSAVSDISLTAKYKIPNS